MLADTGLILGRTFAGKLIRIPRYCHLLLVGTPGSGKGLTLIANLLTYRKGSVVVFDKGDLYQATAGYRWKKLGNNIVRLAPYVDNADRLNPLDLILKESPRLIDDAKAMAESLVVRQGTESDPFWNDRGAQILTGILVYVLLRFSSTRQDVEQRAGHCQ